MEAALFASEAKIKILKNSNRAVPKRYEVRKMFQKTLILDFEVIVKPSLVYANLIYVHSVLLVLYYHYIG